MILSHIENEDIPPIIEVIIWKDFIDSEVIISQNFLKQFKSFLTQQEGFMHIMNDSLKNNKLINVIYWRDIESAKKAAQIALESEGLSKILDAIDEKEIIIEYFDIIEELKS